jgi:uncharacterized protein
MNSNIDKLFKAMNYETNYLNALNGNIDKQLEIDPELKESEYVLRDFILECAGWDRVKGFLEDIFLKGFTASEIKELTDFFDSSLGKKYLEVSTRSSAEIYNLGAKNIIENQQELNKRLEVAELRRKIQSLTD